MRVRLTYKGMVGLLKDGLLRLIALPKRVEGNMDLSLLLLRQLPQALHIYLLDLLRPLS